MTKGQLIEGIQRTAKRMSDCMSKVFDHLTKLSDPSAVVLTEAVAVVGSGIVDALANLTLVLCETLPGAPDRLVEKQDGSFVERLREVTPNDEKEG